MDDEQQQPTNHIQRVSKQLPTISALYQTNSNDMTFFKKIYIKKLINIRTKDNLDDLRGGNTLVEVSMASTTTAASVRGVFGAKETQIFIIIII